MHTLTAAHRAPRRRASVALAIAAGVVGATLAAAPAQAADNPYQRGPAPTASSLTAANGSFQVQQSRISGQRGFGGGQIYYPRDTNAGTFGVIALCPGFTAAWSSISWLGTRLASQGFVVVGIETNSRMDQPNQRGRQLLAALDWATTSSPAASRIDKSRQAVGGHSMGGGGTLEAERSRPSIKAGVPLAPWNTTKSWSDVRVPTAIVGGQSDAIAGVSSHSRPFYNSLRGPKAYLEIRGASHFFPQSPNASQQALSVAWYKRYVDNDTRYSQFLTAQNRPSNASQFLLSGIEAGPAPENPNEPTPPGEEEPDENPWWPWAGR